MSRQEVPHYCAGGIEFIDAMKSMLTPEEFRGAMKFSVCKYLWRERHKGTPVEDLQKAGTYRGWLEEAVREQEAAAKKK